MGDTVVCAPVFIAVSTVRATPVLEWSDGIGWVELGWEVKAGSGKSGTLMQGDLKGQGSRIGAVGVTNVLIQD